VPFFKLLAQMEIYKYSKQLLDKITQLFYTNHKG
jgi:hypothetical protein